MGWLPAGILQDNPIRIFGRRDGDARPGYCGELSAAHRIKKPRIGPQIYALFNPCLQRSNYNVCGHEDVGFSSFLRILD